MENVRCEYCHKEYKNKYTLKSHIATNKKCMALRSNKEDKEDKEDKEEKIKEMKDLFENLKKQPSISKDKDKEEKKVWTCCKDCPYTTTIQHEWYQHSLSCLKYQLEEKNKEIIKLKTEMSSLVTYIFDIGTSMKNTNYTGKTDSVLFGVKNEPKNKIESEKEKEERQEDNSRYVNHICSILCRFRQIQKRHSLPNPLQEKKEDK